MEPCTKSKEIDGICERLDKIEANIDGNGKPGIKGDIIHIRDSQQFMAQTLAALSTNVSALLIFQAEVKTTTTIKEKIKLNTTNVVNIVITAILGLAAVAVSIILKL
jgi:hypothetical protein